VTPDGIVEDAVGGFAFDELGALGTREDDCNPSRNF